MKLYINGRLENQTSVSDTISTTAPLLIGYLNGRIDKVRVYDQALNPAEVSLSYGMNEITDSGGEAIANVTRYIYNGTVWRDLSNYGFVASNASWSYVDWEVELLDLGTEIITFEINTTQAGFNFWVFNTLDGNALLNTTEYNSEAGEYTFDGSIFHPTLYFWNLTVYNATGYEFYSNASIGIDNPFGWVYTFNYSGFPAQNITHYLRAGSSHTNELIPEARRVIAKNVGTNREIEYYDLKGRTIKWTFVDEDELITDFNTTKQNDRYVQSGKLKSHVCQVRMKIRGAKSNLFCEYKIKYESDQEWTLLSTSPYAGHAVSGDFNKGQVVWIDADWDVKGGYTFASLSEDRKTIEYTLYTSRAVREFTTSSLGLINEGNASWNLNWGGGIGPSGTHTLRPDIDYEMNYTDGGIKILNSTFEGLQITVSYEYSLGIEGGYVFGTEIRALLFVAGFILIAGLLMLILKHGLGW